MTTFGQTQPVNINQASAGLTFNPTTPNLQNLTASTVSNPVPTPSGDAKLNTASQPTPTTIVGSGLAADKVNNTIIPTATQANQDIINQNAKNDSNSAGTNNQGIPYTPSSDAQVAQNAANSYKGTATAPPVNYTNAPENTPGTPEHTILNTPSSGYQFIYDSQGNRLELPIGQDVPIGYSTTAPANPQNQVATNTVTQANGITIKQFADGTYGSFDPNGQYQGPTTQDQFTQAQNANSLLGSINQLANGTYPLTASQQAEVDSLKASFATLITQQQTANANFTGGTTIAENLYGMGNSIAGLGEIKGTVDSGIQKIADLNDKMTSAVSDMISGFQKDDLTLLKAAYDTYDNAQQERQAEIDKLKDTAQAKIESDRTYNLQVQTEAFSEKMSNADLDLKTKTETFNEYMQQANLTEQQKQNAIDDYYKGVAASQQAQSLKIQQENADVNMQKLQDDETNSAANVVNNTVSTLNGNRYVNGTGLSSDDKALAVKNGLIVLDGKDLDSATNLNNVQQQFGNLLATMQSAGVLNDKFQFTTIPGPNGVPSNKGATASFTHNYAAGNATDSIIAFNTSIYGDPSKTTDGGLLSEIEKLPNSGDLVSTLKDNKINTTDDAATMQKKITAITTVLGNTENAILHSGMSASSNQPTTYLLNGQTLNLQPDGTYK